MHDFLCMQYGLHLMHFRYLACMNLFNQFQKGGKQDFLILKKKKKRNKKSIVIHPHKQIYMTHYPEDSRLSMVCGDHILQDICTLVTMPFRICSYLYAPMYTFLF